MVEYYLEKGTTTTINPPLGYSLLDVDGGATVNKQFIIIQAEKDFNYYNQLFLDAQKEGIISNAEHAAIIANQGATRQVYELSASYTFDKAKLIDVIDVHGLPISTGGKTAPELTADIIAAGYYVVFNPLFSASALVTPTAPPTSGIGQDFAADATNTAILFKDIDTGAIEKTEHINTLQAVANADGINITIQYTGAEVIIIDKLYLNKTYIDGVLVTQVVATALAELNALFANAGSLGNAPTITGGATLTLNLTYSTTLNHVLAGTDIVAINWDISTTGTVPVGHLATPEGDHRRILGGSLLAVGSYTLYATVTNYFGSFTQTITLVVAIPPFSNTKSWNPANSAAYFRDDVIGQENNNPFYRASGTTSNPWTAFGWTKLDTTGLKPLIGFGDLITNSTGFLILYTKIFNASYHQIAFLYGSNSGNVQGNTYFLMPTGTWFSWAVIYDGTATTSAAPFELYLNGVLVGWTYPSGSYSGSIEYLGTNDSRLHIGKMPVFSATNTGGFWDDMAFWNSDQSANISAFHNSGTPINLGSYSPFSYYRFGDVPTDISAYPQLTNEGTTGNVLTAYTGTVADYVTDTPP